MPISCILVTQRASEMGDFRKGLGAGGAAVETVPDGETALSVVKRDAPDLVVIDEGLSDFEPLPLVVKVIMANALANTAVITSMADKEFHDKSEGFGVLRALPLTPSEQDGKDLVAQVVRVQNLA